MRQAILSCFPPELRQIFQRIPVSEWERMQEIRLRVGRPIAVHCGQAEQFLHVDGTCNDRWTDAVFLKREQLDAIFHAACEYSVYRYQREIAEGYVTIQGGNRIGICGTAVFRDGQYVQMRNISGLNIRLARQVKDCAKELAAKLCSQRLTSILLAGTVGSGKTTMLRDLCRILGQTYRLCIIDSRGELAAVQNSVPQYEIGLHTDVYDGFPRAEGAVMALRVMAPDGLVCDEISTAEDAAALMQVYGCGVQILATAHAANEQDLYRRTALRTLLEAGVFEYLVLLRQGSVQKIQRVAAC